MARKSWRLVTDAEKVLAEPARTVSGLRRRLAVLAGVSVPLEPVVEGNDTGLDYLVHAYFEGKEVEWGDGGEEERERWEKRGGSECRVQSDECGGLGSPCHLVRDCVVWANRGGGKTFLAAVATLMDLIDKPGIQVTILGGSLEQSQRMYEHLRRLFEGQVVKELLAAKVTEREVVLTNGSRATVLAQSQASVRGTRVQKMRCDEVELFDPEIWEAVQLTTRSMRCDGAWGGVVHGSVEALSTMHRPHGLMWKIVGESEEKWQSGKVAEWQSKDGAPPPFTLPLGHSATLPLCGAAVARRRLFRWGVLDALEHCGAERECGTCPLEGDCGGRAKLRAEGAAGHIRIDDAVRMKLRVSEGAWKSEMLCLRPRRSDCVYAEFNRAVHVGDWPPPSAPMAHCLDPDPFVVIAGMDFGFRAPTVVLLAWVDAAGVLRIEAEHVESEQTLEHHIRVIVEGRYACLGAKWQSGKGAEWQSDGKPSSPVTLSLCHSATSPLNPGATLPLLPQWIAVDPAGHQRSEQTGISPIQALRKAGLVVKARRMTVQEGIGLIAARLKPAEGGPRLLIHKRCANLIEALERYHYPEDNPHSMEPVKDGPDHCADALRYLVVNLDRPYITKVSNYLL